mmetsp:Transcript_13194/g.23431  ORF Transcript_13194/g.23431 Transcript_13194/m.23431 type:complete len:297 (+) Transcript_13194:630-1520(+)
MTVDILHSSLFVTGYNDLFSGHVYHSLFSMKLNLDNFISGTHNDSNIALVAPTSDTDSFTKKRIFTASTTTPPAASSSGRRGLSAASLIHAKATSIAELLPSLLYTSCTLDKHATIGHTHSGMNEQKGSMNVYNCPLNTGVFTSYYFHDGVFGNWLPKLIHGTGVSAHVVQFTANLLRGHRTNVACLQQNFHSFRANTNDYTHLCTEVDQVLQLKALQRVPCLSDFSRDLQIVNECNNFFRSAICKHYSFPLLRVFDNLDHTSSFTSMCAVENFNVVSGFEELHQVARGKLEVRNS